MHKFIVVAVARTDRPFISLAGTKIRGRHEHLSHAAVFDEQRNAVMAAETAANAYNTPYDVVEDYGKNTQRIVMRALPSDTTLRNPNLPRVLG